MSGWFARACAFFGWIVPPPQHLWASSKVTDRSALVGGIAAWLGATCEPCCTRAKANSRNGARTNVETGLRRKRLMRNRPEGRCDPANLDRRGERWLPAHCERSNCNPGRRRSDVISYPAIASKGRVDDEPARIRTYFD
jgi:hypothetical protein